MSISQRPRYEYPYETTHAVNPRTAVEGSGIPMAKKPPTVVHRIPMSNITKNPLTARYTMMDTRRPICEKVNLAERLIVGR